MRPSSDDANLAPRIRTGYKIKDAAAVEGLRSAQKRQQRKIKRTVAALAGWGLMGFMVYLIMVTTPLVAKVWNPYDILGIAEASRSKPRITSPND